MNKMYSWSTISDAPDEPGIYAWYYSPEITDFDLERVKEAVLRLRDQNERSEAIAILEEFLDRTIFRCFQEEPFSAALRGPLKPSYEGMLTHKPAMSQSLLDRLIEDPNRLLILREILCDSTPEFASPLYIGMSEHLRERLSKHKKLIERYRQKMPSIMASATKNDWDERRDHSFALQVVDRKIIPQRLFVMVRVIDGQGAQYVDIENILNRIHYPLFGRN